MASRSSVHVLIVLLAMAVFFTSGFAALIYQVLWQRLLAMFSGADVYSATLIVAAFMAGLGLGHLAGGHVADRVTTRMSLLYFAAAEVSIGAFGAFSPTLYYEILYQRFGHLNFGAAGTTAVLFASLLWPTFFMGASLPLLARALTARIDRAGRTIGALYAVNTVGAACGAFIATWWLLPARGLAWTLQAAAALNVLCAAVLLPLAVMMRSALVTSAANAGAAVPSREAIVGTRARCAAPLPERGTDAAFPFGVWCVLYGLAGFFALSIEIVWFRMLGVMMKSTAFTFGTLLTLYLAGLGLGALAGSATVPWVRRPGLTFLVLQAIITLAVAASLVLLVSEVRHVPWLWSYFGSYESLHVGNGLAALFAGREEGTRFVLIYFALPALLVMPVTMLMGAGFPLLQQAVQTDASRIGRRVGQLLLANIIGSLAGCVITGWVLLDRAGAAGTIQVLVTASGTFIVLVLRHVLGGRLPRLPATVVAAAVTAAVIAVIATWSPDTLQLWSRLHGSEAPDMIVHEDGSGVSAIRRIGTHAVVFVNGMGQSQLPYGDIHTALGAVPAFIHSAPRSIAVIGLGSGDTTWAAAGRPDVERVTAVEIVRSQLRSLERLHERWPYRGLATLLTDPRIEHVFADGRTHLLRSGHHYDIIEADALRPSSAYSGTLYSDGYFRLVRDRLNPGGLAATWAPTPRVLNSVVRVFPHVMVLPDIVVASDAPIQVDWSSIAARASAPQVADYYRAGGVDILPLLQARTTVRQVYGPEFDRTTITDFNTDLFPRDEYDVRPAR